MASACLTEAAAIDLRIILRSSLMLGLIGPDVFLARIAALRDMSIPGTAVAQYCATILRAEDWEEDEPKWTDENSTAVATRASDDLDDRSNVIRGDDGDDILQFIPAVSAGLHDWYFRDGLRHAHNEFIKIG
jgi:hypothetical protein